MADTTSQRSVLLSSLAAALRSGHEPRAALELLGEDDLDRRLARSARTLAGRLSGKSLPEGMALMPRTFDPATVEIVREGERSGRLPDYLELVAADNARSADLGPRIALAMIFPLIGLCGAILILLLFAVFVLPSFKQTFVSFGTDLPSLTLAYIGIGDLIAGYWYLLILLAVALVLLVAWRGSFFYGRALDRLLLRMPFFGDQLWRMHGARMAGLLADAARMNIDARAALIYLRDTAGNGVLADRTAALINEAGAASSMTNWLAQSRSVPRRLSIAAGTHTDPQRLALALADAAGQYAEAARTGSGRIERNTFIWAYVIVGLIVGSFVIAMYLPMFKLGSL